VANGHVMQVKHERSADTLALGARAVVPSRMSIRDKGKDGAVGKLGKFLNRGFPARSGYKAQGGAKADKSMQTCGGLVPLR
jgi:hypothetical protein